MSIRLTIVETELRCDLIAAGFESYEDYADCERGAVVHRSGTATTRRLELRFAGQACAYFLKTYRYQGARWRHRFRRDKASIEAENYDILRERCGVHVPEVVAHGARRRGVRLLDAFIMTRGIPDGRTLDAFTEERWGERGQERGGRIARERARACASERGCRSEHGHGRAREQERGCGPEQGRAPEPSRVKVGDPIRHRLLAETAAIVSRMHEAGFCHIDLQWRNLFIRTTPGEAPRVYLLDSPRGGLRRGRANRHHGRMRDLSSLLKDARRFLTRTEQMRWLCAYLGVSTLTSEHRRLIWALMHDRAIKDNAP